MGGGGGGETRRDGAAVVTSRERRRDGDEADERGGGSVAFSFARMVLLKSLHFWRARVLDVELGGDGVNGEDFPVAPPTIGSRPLGPPLAVSAARARHPPGVRGFPGLRARSRRFRVGGRRRRGAPALSGFLPRRCAQKAPVARGKSGSDRGSRGRRSPSGRVSPSPSSRALSPPSRALCPLPPLRRTPPRIERRHPGRRRRRRGRARPRDPTPPPVASALASPGHNPTQHADAPWLGAPSAATAVGAHSRSGGQGGGGGPAPAHPSRTPSSPPGAGIARRGARRWG